MTVDYKRLRELSAALSTLGPWHVHEDKRMAGGVFATIGGYERQLLSVSGQAIQFSELPIEIASRLVTEYLVEVHEALPVLLAELDNLKSELAQTRAELRAAHGSIEDLLRVRTERDRLQELLRGRMSGPADADSELSFTRAYLRVALDTSAAAEAQIVELRTELALTALEKLE